MVGFLPFSFFPSSSAIEAAPFAPFLLCFWWYSWFLCFPMGFAVESQFHVLAVDDSLIDRRLIEKLLKTSSFQVTTVDSGSKALEFLGFNHDDKTHAIAPSISPHNQKEVEVNLIITDYCMPGMTGYDLLKKIKESSSLRNIPVVVMSSENVPSRITRCLEEGADEFFLKPVRLADMSRLKPHMMKTKMKDHHKQEQGELQGNNKRKAMEEEDLSPDRTRPRFNGVATVS